MVSKEITRDSRCLEEHVAIRNQFIIEGIRKGDNTVLRTFYRRNIPYLQNLILKNSGTHEDAEDVIQEAMIFLLEKIKTGDFVLSCSIHTYFYSVCKNMWRNRRRKLKKYVSYEEVPEKYKNGKYTMPYSMEEEHQNVVFKSHFSKLNERSRRIWELSFQGKSNKEIALRLECSEGSVRKRKHDSKKILIRSMKNDRLFLELIA